MFVRKETGRGPRYYDTPVLYFLVSGSCQKLFEPVTGCVLLRRTESDTIGKLLPSPLRAPLVDALSFSRPDGAPVAS